ncbi:MAG TPA: acyl carrier protein [Thermoflexia bacterium]|nr:acyl carrier protein [Thermoflexia bacterium]
MKEKIYAQVKSIVADILAVDEEILMPDTKFRDDLGADSLDLVELIMGFEDEFGGHISDEDARDIVTVEDAAEYLVNNV